MKHSSFFALFVCFVALSNAAPIPAPWWETTPYTPIAVEQPSIVLPGPQDVHYDPYGGAANVYYGGNHMPEHMGHVQGYQELHRGSRGPMPLGSDGWHNYDRPEPLRGISRGSKTRLPGLSHIEGGFASNHRSQMEAHPQHASAHDTHPTGVPSRMEHTHVPHHDAHQDTHTSAPHHNVPPNSHQVTLPHHPAPHQQGSSGGGRGPGKMSGTAQTLAAHGIAPSNAHHDAQAPAPLHNVLRKGTPLHYPVPHQQGSSGGGRKLGNMSGKVRTSAPHHDAPSTSHHATDVHHPVPHLQGSSGGGMKSGKQSAKVHEPHHDAHTAAPHHNVPSTSHHATNSHHPAPHHQGSAGAGKKSDKMSGKAHTSSPHHNAPSTPHHATDAHHPEPHHQGSAGSGKKSGKQSANAHAHESHRDAHHDAHHDSHTPASHHNVPSASHHATDAHHSVPHQGSSSGGKKVGKTSTKAHASATHRTAPSTSHHAPDAHHPAPQQHGSSAGVKKSTKQSAKAHTDEPHHDTHTPASEHNAPSTSHHATDAHHATPHQQASSSGGKTSAKKSGKK